MLGRETNPLFSFCLSFTNYSCIWVQRSVRQFVSTVTNTHRQTPHSTCTRYTASPLKLTSVQSVHWLFEVNSNKNYKLIVAIATNIQIASRIVKLNDFPGWFRRIKLQHTQILYTFKLISLYLIFFGLCCCMSMCLRSPAKICFHLIVIQSAKMRVSATGD